MQIIARIATLSLRDLSQDEVVTDDDLLTWPRKRSPRAHRAALRGL